MITISLLDRLLDDESQELRDSQLTYQQQIKNLFLSVQRDLENLLNTRAYLLNRPKIFTELEASLFNYGIADFSLQPLETLSEKTKFCQQIKKLIQYFEPRFKEVNIQLLQSQTTIDRTLCLRIIGLLVVESISGPIVFDSILQPEIKIQLSQEE